MYPWNTQLTKVAMAYRFGGVAEGDWLTVPVLDNANRNSFRDVDMDANTAELKAWQRSNAAPAKQKLCIGVSALVSS